MTQPTFISSPDDPLLDELCRQLRARAAETDVSGRWPGEQLELCARHGVFRWFLPKQWGGDEWSEADILRGYLKLSAVCLTTTFILTQRMGACRRIAECEHDELKSRLLPGLVSGEAFTTVGISHLTTSRRHLAQAVLRASAVDDESFRLDGYSPWVTGARHAQTVVLGAALDDGQQALFALPTSLPGVSAPPPARLLALSASDTGELRCGGVRVGREWLLAGPAENVLASHVGGNTGGLQTSTLAIGLASAAIEFLFAEAAKRTDLRGPADNLRQEHDALREALLGLAAGRPVCTGEDLRARANSLVLRASQAALAAAKGAGYVLGHPAGRWCREAMFFLVWSCPQPVVNANLCELAGLGAD